MESAFWIANTQLLKGVIDAYGSSLGTTVSGRAWSLKALHPSDPVTDVVGVPDRTAVSTACINYQQSVTIAAPAGAVGSWGGEIRVLPDPTVFATVSMRDDDATHAYNAAHFNTAVGDSFKTVIDHWEGYGLERWRLLYYGVTVYLDAPATASQGSIVAAQYAVRHNLYSPSFPTSSGLNVCQYLGCRYQASDTPAYETLHQMPNAYAGLALDGCYLPLKLDGSHAEWHDARDIVGDGSNWQTSSGTANLMVPMEAGITTIGPYAPWPHMWYDEFVGAWRRDRHLLPMQANLATIALAGLSLQATVRIVYRVGVEVMAQPGTAMAPFMKMAPGFDAVAVDSYFRIARELKDAYPAEYNDSGKLWNVIKSVASKVAPVVLPFLGPVGPLVKAAAGVIAPVVDRAVAKKKEPAAPAPALPAGDLARASNQVRKLVAARKPLPKKRRP